MVIDLFPISWFPINLFTQMPGYSMRTAVTKSRQQDEEIKQNKTTARKIGLREEKRKPMRDEEIFANYFRALPWGSMTITTVSLKGSNIIFGNFPIVFVIF